MRLLSTVADDVKQLLPHLHTRCEVAATDAKKKLDGRGELEAKEMVSILQKQKSRIDRELEKLQAPDGAQLLLEFDDNERQQLRDNAKFWQRRLDAIPREIEREPLRIRESYVTRATRIEPVGIVYLWPMTG